MDVNDSGTIKLGEVCTFYHIRYFEKFIKVNTISFYFQAWVMLQSSTVCNNMSLSDLLNTVNKFGNVCILYLYSIQSYFDITKKYIKYNINIMYLSRRNLQDIDRWISGKRWPIRIANQFRAVLRSSQRVIVDADEE